jgi:uncharacterized tellurite resistance protein B-like protein
MFNRIKDLIRLEGPLANDMMNNNELRIAVVTLLVAAGLSTSEFDNSDLDRAVEFSKNEFEFSDREATQLLEIVHLLQADGVKNDALWNGLRSTLSTDQRVNLLSTVWKILLCDGRIERSESEFAVTARKKLDLSMEQAVLAQQIASDRDLVESTH